MNREDMIRVIIDLVCDVMEMEPEKIETNKSFGEMGLDSLAILEVVEGIEEKLEVRLEDDELQELFNLNDVYDLVWSRLPNREE